MSSDKEILEKIKLGDSFWEVDGEKLSQLLASYEKRISDLEKDTENLWRLMKDKEPTPQIDEIAPPLTDEQLRKLPKHKCDENCRHTKKHKAEPTPQKGGHIFYGDSEECACCTSKKPEFESHDFDDIKLSTPQKEKVGWEEEFISFSSKLKFNKDTADEVRAFIKFAIGNTTPQKEMKLTGELLHKNPNPYDEMLKDKPTPQKECVYSALHGMNNRTCICGAGPQKECECGTGSVATICPTSLGHNPPKTDWAEKFRHKWEGAKSEFGTQTLGTKTVNEMVNDIRKLLSEKEQETREEIGREFKKWFTSKDDEIREKGWEEFKRILGIKI